LDIGAHHGLYTLLASRRVGRRGMVVAFEPSPRERRRLAKHLRVNRCANVEVEACAVGDASS
jgi:FkbM family methyltransferase